MFTIVGILVLFGLWFCFTKIRTFYNKKLDSLSGVIVQLDVQRKILAISMLSPVEGKTEVDIGTIGLCEKLVLIIPSILQSDVYRECSVRYGNKQELLLEYIHRDDSAEDYLNAGLDKYLEHNFPKWNLCLPK